MTWQRAKKIAAQYAARLGLPPRLDGVTVKLADYETEATHSILKQGQQWSLEFERMVTRAFGRDLARRGAKVETVQIRLDEFMAWLEKEKLPNTTENRAAFVETKTQ